MAATGWDLDVACSLVRGLVEQLQTGPAVGLVDHDVRERDARRAFDQFPVPAAVYGSAGTRIELTNRAWRFELALVPDAMLDIVTSVVATARMVHVPKLAIARDGTAADYEVVAHPLRSALGTVTGAIVVCVGVDRRWFASAVHVDDSELAASERAALLSAAQTARAEAELANRLKDQFLATLSHELRAPVATMLLWERILRDETRAAVREQALDAIRQSAQAQARIVGDLLDVSRAISGKLFVDMQPVALDVVVAESIGALSATASAKGVELISVGSLAVSVEGDAARLRQVVDNLLLNAVKFTASGGRIEVRQRRKAGSVVIEIADTGRGIALEALDRIFDPFHQTDERGGGLGLGLAIARQLAELHGGSLRAASEGLGRGATFTLALPLSRNAVATSATHEIRSKPLQGKRVLVIDDDARIRNALTLLLERGGALVIAAGSAARGREVIEHESPDVVICDIAMPEEDGHSFARSLRGAGNHIPAIALTAHALASDSATALDAGFDLHVAKPVNFDRLVSSIAALLTRTARV